MAVSTLVFWLIVLLTIGGAVTVVVARNILHAALALCLAFLGVAGLYVFLHADFLAAAQLIVYVGGILVLIIFAIMFSSNAMREEGEHRRSWLALVAGIFVGALMLCVVVLLTKRLAVPLAAAAGNATAAFQPTAGVAAGQTGLGHLLMGPYLLPFEVVSVVLLATLIGAVVIARKELQANSDDSGEDKSRG
jgi:NADH-quinone oxidoreductase subunit J